MRIQKKNTKLIAQSESLRAAETEKKEREDKEMADASVVSHSLTWCGAIVGASFALSSHLP